MNPREHLIDFKDPEERVTVTWDFAPDLGADTITPASAVVTVSLKRGDPDPGLGTLVYAAAQIVGSKVLVGIANGLNGRDYRIKCKVDTAGNHTYAQAYVLPVRDA